MTEFVSIPAGIASLGRGLASIPTASLQEAGLPSTLSTLAEDAVTVSAQVFNRLHVLLG